MPRSSGRTAGSRDWLPVLPKVVRGADESMDVFRWSSGRDGATGIQNKSPAGLPHPDEFLRSGAHLCGRSSSDDSTWVNIPEKNMVGSRHRFCSNGIGLVIQFEPAPRILRKLLNDR